MPMYKTGSEVVRDLLYEVQLMRMVLVYLVGVLRMVICGPRQSRTGVRTKSSGESLLINA